jgi:hypothetical protein
MGEHQEQVAKKYRRMDFDELADAPLEALGCPAATRPPSSRPLASRPSASWRNTGSSAAHRRS